MATSPPLRVAIVGGGFAGLALAIGLQKYAHLDVQVYEAAERFSEIGAGITFGPNAQQAMRLLDPEIFEAWKRRTNFQETPPDENGLYTHMEITKGQVPDMGQITVQYKHHTKGSTMHRAHFLDELIKLLDLSRAHFSKRLKHIYQTIDDSIPNILHFTDGSTVAADIVIGADGIRSVVRKHVLGPDHPAAKAYYTGHVIYRTLVPMAEAKARLGDIKQKVGLRCGRNGVVFGYPINDGKQYFLSVTAFNYGSWSHDKWSKATDVEAMKAKFADWDDFSRRQVSLFPNNGGTMAWSLWEMPLAPTYFRGRVAIMGDAAHGCTPFQGAGAGQSIEDALILEQLFGKYLAAMNENSSRGRSSWRVGQSPTAQQIVPWIFQAYDTVRRFRSQKVTTTSMENGRILSGNDPGVGDRAADIRKASASRQEWIISLDQEQQVKDACQIFETIRDAGERHMQAQARGAKL